MSGAGARFALAVGSLAAGGVGWFAAGQLHSNDPQTGTALDAVSIYSCPEPGAAAIGGVSTGEQLQLIGVTDDRWAVIQHPDKPGQMAWLPLALVDTDANAGDLPQLTCGAAATATATTVASATTTTQLVTDTSTTTTTTSTTSTTSTIATTSTVSSDVTPPTVTLTANRTHFYVSPVSATCIGEDRLEITVAVADPTVPLSIQSIQASWVAPAGAQTANLTPLGGNRFLLQITTNGPSSGELPVTITATASDGAGNVGSGQLIVPLRHPASFGCG